MMFAGGSPEAQKLVNQALAARAEANGAGTPPPGGAGPNATAPIAMIASEARGANDSQATPPPVARPRGGGRDAEGPGAASNARRGDRGHDGRPASGEDPRRRHRAERARQRRRRRRRRRSRLRRARPLRRQEQAAASPGRSRPAPRPSGRRSGSSKGTSIRWSPMREPSSTPRAPKPALKRQPRPPEPEIAAAVEEKPLEDRYRDDGTVSVDDRKKYSLRSGATSASLPTVGGVVPGDRMSAEEMMGEIGGGKRTVIIIAAIAVVLAVVVGMYLAFRGKHVAQSAAALTPVQVPTQPTPTSRLPRRPPAPAPLRRPPPQPLPLRRRPAPADAPAAAGADDEQAPKAHAALPPRSTRPRSPRARSTTEAPPGPLLPVPPRAAARAVGRRRRRWRWPPRRRSARRPG